MGRHEGESMGFLKDKAVGEEGEELVLRLLQSYHQPYTWEKCGEKNKFYDFIGYTSVPGDSKTVEVKFDVKAAETGNICFEIGTTYKDKDKPGKKTGVCISQADEFWYVLKKKDGYSILIFDTVKLLQHLLYIIATKTKDVKVLYGGDDKRFCLAIVNAKALAEEKDLYTLIKV